MTDATAILVLRLSDQTPIAAGTQRTVYLHPDDPQKLLKVLKPQADTAKRSGLATVAEKYIPSIRTRWARKEYAEYLRLMLANPTPFQLPITHMHGFAHTDVGLACITEAVRIGDTLGQTLSKNVSPSDLALLNDTITRIYAYDIRAGDMTARNFVFGHRGNGPRECVLVDGFGDIHAIPVRSLGGWANRIGLDDSCKRLAARTDLRWDPKQRQFHAT